MPIKVSCACGQAFAAKDELAGKTVKCPKCAQPLKIPTPMAAVASGPARPSAAVQTGSFFDDAGLTAAPVGANLCPGCAQPLAQNAVLCIKCGYNVKLGRKMQTMSSSGGAAGGGGDGSHGDVAATLLAKAAEDIEDAKDEERKKTSEGLPWWVYLIAMMAVVGFMVMMMMLPVATGLFASAGFLFLAGGLVCLYSGIRLIITAFEESPLQGILYLLVPLYPLFYVFSRWDRCSSFFMLNLGGTAIIGFAYALVWAAAIASEWKTDEESAAPAPRPAIVCSVDAFSSPGTITPSV